MIIFLHAKYSNITQNNTKYLHGKTNLKGVITNLLKQGRYRSNKNYAFRKSENRNDSDFFLATPQT